MAVGRSSLGLAVWWEISLSLKRLAIALSLCRKGTLESHRRRLFLYTNLQRNLERAKNEASPVIRKSIQKMSRLRLFGGAVKVWSEQLVRGCVHPFSVLLIVELSFTFKIAFDISGAKGEPMGKA